MRGGGGGGGLETNVRGYAGERKEHEMRGVLLRKNFEGVCRRGVKKTKCGGGGFSGKCLLKGGQILNGIAHCVYTTAFQ